MKKLLICVVMVTGLSAQASWLDWSQIFRTAGVIATYIGNNLEQLRLASQQNMNIQEQWDMACNATKALNPSILAFNKILAENKVNDKLCAPITPLIRLQTDIIANCNNFYSKPVPENAQIMLQKFAITVFQAKLILTKCYPALAKVNLPFPGGN